MPTVDTIQIPNRSLFRQPEVCEIAQLQPYVLRSWEAEFPDLGVAKTEGGPRVYRRTDVERVLRIKHLLFVDGLTLAGARRKMQEEQGSPDPNAPGLETLFSRDARERITQVRQMLRELAAMLAQKPGAGNGEFRLASPAVKTPVRTAKAAPKSASKPAARRRSR